MGDLETAKKVIQGLLRWADRQTCPHESTHRGGAIWEICDECGMKWADDKGGKPEYVDPPELAAARDFLTPPPLEIEDVPLEQWAVVAPSGYVERACGSEDTAIDLTTMHTSQFFGYRVVKLTGHFQRPKPVKVERSVSVEGSVDKVGMCNYETNGDEYQAEFKKHPECHGKRGVITFTWQE